jgi:hypothetical protein
MKYVSRIKAYNGYYWSNYLSTIISATPAARVPDSPINVYMDVYSDSKVLVWWQAPLNDGGKPITGYSVQWSTDESFSQSSNNYFVTNEKLSYIIENLSVNSKYIIRVASYNALGYSEYTLAKLHTKWASEQSIAFNLSSITSNSYTLTVNDAYNTYTTQSIPFPSSETDIRDALQTLEIISTVTVKRVDQSIYFESTSSTAIQIVYYVKFLSVLSGKVTGAMVSSALSPTITVLNVGTSPLNNQLQTRITNPSAPLDVTVVSVSSTELGVSWKEPLSNGGSPIAKYLIEWDYDPYFTHFNDSSYHKVVTYDTAKNNNKLAVFAYQITSLSDTKLPVYVRVSAMNSHSFYSIAAHAWPLNVTNCNTMPTHCSIVPTIQLLHKVVTPYVQLSLKDISNRLEVTWQQPLTDYYGFSSASSTNKPNIAKYYRIEWSQENQFLNPVRYDARMLITGHDDKPDECETNCTLTIGLDVQKMLLMSNNLEPPNDGKFALSYVGKQSKVKLYLMVKALSSSITVLNSNTPVVIEVGDLLRIADTVYQIVKKYSDGVYDLHTPFKGGFTDVTQAFYSKRPTTCLDFNATASVVDSYIESLDDFTGLGLDPIDVSGEKLTLGKSWLITFNQAVFTEDVEDLVVFHPTGSDLLPPACVKQFSTVSGPTFLTTLNVTKTSRAGSLLTGTPVFVRVIPINDAGIGPHNLCDVSTDGTPTGSISPRSPPGLPINVHVFAVPSSTGEYLKVTWKRGNTYGGPLLEHIVEWKVDGTSTWTSKTVPEVLANNT